MDAEHGHFRLIGPGSAEITLYADQSRTRVGINKELGQRRLFQSVCIGLHTRHQINRLSSDRDLPEQCQRRVPVCGVPKRPAVFTYFVDRQISPNLPR